MLVVVYIDITKIYSRMLLTALEETHIPNPVDQGEQVISKFLPKQAPILNGKAIFDLKHMLDPCVSL